MKFKVKNQSESMDTPRIMCVPVSDTCRVRHRHGTDTHNYIELCDFLKLLAVLACRCIGVRIRQHIGIETLG